MQKFIFFLIAVGLLWNCQNSISNGFEKKSKKSLTFNFLEEELSKEHVDNNEDKELEKINFLAIYNVTNLFNSFKSSKDNTYSPTLLSYISPVFTPPPNLS